MNQATYPHRALFSPSKPSRTIAAVAAIAGVGTMACVSSISFYQGAGVAEQRTATNFVVGAAALGLLSLAGLASYRISRRLDMLRLPFPYQVAIKAANQIGYAHHKLTRYTLIYNEKTSRAGDSQQHRYYRTKHKMKVDQLERKLENLIARHREVLGKFGISISLKPSTWSNSRQENTSFLRNVLQAQTYRCDVPAGVEIDIREPAKLLTALQAIQMPQSRVHSIVPESFVRVIRGLLTSAKLPYSFGMSVDAHVSSLRVVINSDEANRPLIDAELVRLEKQYPKPD